MLRHTVILLFFFKQKTAYEMRISDWSSDVCSSDLRRARRERSAEERGPRPSPREVQAHIRAGMSAQEVAALMGARLEDVVKFEHPISEERRVGKEWVRTCSTRWHT